MKRLILVFIFMLFVCCPTHAAKAVKVEAVTDFYSLNPANTMQVVTMEKAEFKNGIVFENGTLVSGEIFDVKQPTRGKRNATFKFKPVSYTYLGKTTQINEDEFYAKYAPLKELDKGKIATSAATTAGGLVFNIPFISQGVSLVKGMWKNKEDNRLKSGVVQVYKDSPLSYIEEGHDLEIKEKDVFVLKFKLSTHEDLDSEEQYQESQEEYVRPVSNSVPYIESESKDIQVKHPEEILKEVEAQNRAK